jgi:hypothetical protein
VFFVIVVAEDFVIFVAEGSGISVADESVVVVAEDSLSWWPCGGATASLCGAGNA